MAVLGLVVGAAGRYADADTALHRYIGALNSSLDATCGDWKVLFGHHPMLAAGAAGAGARGKLRSGGRCASSACRAGKRMSACYNASCRNKPGGLEDVAVIGGVDAYLSGHVNQFMHTVRSMGFCPVLFYRRLLARHMSFSVSPCRQRSSLYSSFHPWLWCL
jgi:hypothetical protein